MCRSAPGCLSLPPKAALGGGGLGEKGWSVCCPSSLLEAVPAFGHGCEALLEPTWVLWGHQPIRQGCILVQFCCYDNQSEEALGDGGRGGEALGPPGVWHGFLRPFPRETPTGGLLCAAESRPGTLVSPGSSPAHEVPLLDEPEVWVTAEPPPGQCHRLTEHVAAAAGRVSQPPDAGHSRGRSEAPSSVPYLPGVLLLLWLLTHQPPPVGRLSCCHRHNGV